MPRLATRYERKGAKAVISLDPGAWEFVAATTGIETSPEPIK